MITTEERSLIHWLSQEDVSQYGECHGKTLDSLIAKGLAEFLNPETDSENTFIAKGRGIMFRAVRLTDAGRIAI